MLLTTIFLAPPVVLQSFTVPPVPGVGVPRAVNPSRDTVALRISIPSGNGLFSPVGCHEVPLLLSLTYRVEAKFRRKSVLPETARALVL